jgi:hypothetical protein
MSVIVVVIVRMIMVMVVTMAMLVTMACISTAHRVKGCEDLMHIGAKTFQHRLDDVIAQNQDSVGRDCSRQVAVADMPGNFRKMSAIAPLDFVERLVGGDDTHDRAVVEHQLISREQHHGFWKIYENVISVRQVDGLTTQMALVKLQYGRTERR